MLHHFLSWTTFDVSLEAGQPRDTSWTFVTSPRASHFSPFNALRDFDLLTTMTSSSSGSLIWSMWMLKLRRVDVLSWQSLPEIFLASPLEPTPRTASLDFFGTRRLRVGASDLGEIMEGEPDVHELSKDLENEVLASADKPAAEGVAEISRIDGTWWESWEMTLVQWVFDRFGNIFA